MARKNRAETGRESMNVSALTRSRLIIAATFVVALILSVVPVPTWAEQFRPDWVGLVLIYWCMATPHRVGIGSAWLVGLLQDVLYGALLGQYALSKTIIAFLAVKLHLRVRVVPPWQQALAVLVMLAVGQLFVIWVRAIIGKPVLGFSYWTPSIVSMVAWPWIFIILRDIRRRGQVS
jgi:rod shape-determining protein MreD